ncbi:glycosyltransferase [Schlesneria sp.]|uniref:glycosyltransferase n=1 Tax=Schlesneria sp. TaxID=2762018 RepID=UPI002F1BDF8E
MTNAGKWEVFFRGADPFPFGADTTYQLGAEFLSGCRDVEDWGCGAQWFRQVMSGINPDIRVTGLDGSAGLCDRVVDLCDYVPTDPPDGLMMRHVLELNADWRTILDQALKSFTHRMVLILYTPMADEEKSLCEYLFPDGSSCAYLALPQHELEQMFERHGLRYVQEAIAIPGSQFGHETLYRISRPQRISIEEGGPVSTERDRPVGTGGDLPFVSCVCPTFGRPALLANALACYLAQDYPLERRELIVLDDAGQYGSQAGEGWEVISVPRRFRSLPEKYNALAGLARGDLIVVWEDDDLYLPWHISAHVRALGSGLGYSKPSRVLSSGTETLQTESAVGRFHASIAFRRQWLERVPGWPLTRRGNFDQQFMSKLARLGPTADPLESDPPSYIFRWASTGDYHGSALMASPEDEGWYGRVEIACQSDSPSPLRPCFDKHTVKCFAELQIPLPHLHETSSRRPSPAG